jgi:protein-disulfide isomerase
VHELTSAAVPPEAADDHVRGEGPGAVLYMDLACPHCAGVWQRLREVRLHLCVRHFPIASKRPRSEALHTAAEAGAVQSEAAFWSLWDSLYADRGHSDDPHLWQRARAAGLDLDRFERDRRSAAVAERVRRDFRGGIRAGVTATPTAFVSGARVEGDLVESLVALAA